MGLINALEFNQSQFLSSGARGEGHWIVPITLCCGSMTFVRISSYKQNLKHLMLRTYWQVTYMAIMQRASNLPQDKCWQATYMATNLIL